MDKNQITGLILMLVLVTVYFQFLAPDPTEIIQEPDEITQVDSLASVSETRPEVQEVVMDDSTRQALGVLKYGSFSANAEGNDATTKIETSKLSLEFSNKGGFLSKVSLKEFTSYDGQPVTLMVPGRSIFDIGFQHLGKNLQFRDLYFDSDTRNLGDSSVVTFSLQLENGSSVKQIYTLYQDRYELGYHIVSDGFEKSIDVKDLILTWDHKANRVEPHMKDPQQRSTVRYSIPESGVDYLSNTSTSFEEEIIEQKISWVAFKQKYFTSAIYAKNNFSRGTVTSDINLQDTLAVKDMYLTAEVPFTDLASGDTQFKFYFGPNEYDDLDEFAEGFNENLNLGWSILSIVNKYLILPIWRFLESFISSYAILIIILVVIIRLILSPLTFKSHMSMAKMRVLKPELDEIKEKNGDDAQAAPERPNGALFESRH